MAICKNLPEFGGGGGASPPPQDGNSPINSVLASGVNQTFVVPSNCTFLEASADGVELTLDFGDPSLLASGILSRCVVHCKTVNSGTIKFSIDAPSIWENKGTDEVIVDVDLVVAADIFNATTAGGVLQITPFFPSILRKKVEIGYSGLSLVLVDGVTANLVNILKGEVQDFGVLAPYFNTVTDKLNVYNDDASLYFKLSLFGSYAGGGSNKGIVVDFVSTGSDVITANKPTEIPGDFHLFQTSLSVDRNGGLATNGSDIDITAYGADYTINNVLLIAEQSTIETQLNAV